MLKEKLAHFYSWDEVPLEDIERVLEEFAAAGHCRMVLGDFWTTRIASDPAFCKYLQGCFEHTHTTPCGSHAPFMDGTAEALFSDDPASKFIQTHMRLLELLPAEFGTQTYTLHLGPLPPGKTTESFSEMVLRGLERLLPVAEKNGITIAVENAFDVNSSPEYLVKYVQHFNSRHLGCCLDFGHANVIAAAPGKTCEQLAEYVRRANPQGFEFRQYSILEYLLPHIVVTHWHDNNGLADQHKLPGDGTVDWQEVIAKLPHAPRLLAVENEMCPRGTPVSVICRTYDELFAE